MSADSFLSVLGRSGPGFDAGFWLVLSSHSVFCCGKACCVVFAVLLGLGPLFRGHAMARRIVTYTRHLAGPALGAQARARAPAERQRRRGERFPPLFAVHAHDDDGQHRLHHSLPPPPRPLGVRVRRGPAVQMRRTERRYARPPCDL